MAKYNAILFINGKPVQMWGSPAFPEYVKEEGEAKRQKKIEEEKE